MAAETNAYRRLPGRGRKLAVMGGISTLWIGADHLLQIDNNRYSEDYRRFYFADIQAITLRRTRRQEITGWILGALLLLTIAYHIFALTTGSSDPIVVWISAGFFEALFVIPLIFSLLGGPTCICQIQTAVQRETLTPLTKVRTALKAIEQIRMAVTAVQGEAAAELLIPQPAATPVRVARPHPTPSITPSPTESLRKLSLLFGILTMIAGVVVISQDTSAWWDYLLQGVLVTAQVVIAIFIVNRASDKATWTKIILAGFWIFFVAVLISLYTQAGTGAAPPQITRYFLGWGTTGLFGFLAIIEIFGLLLSRNQTATSAASPSTPPPVPLAAFKDLE